MTKTQTTTPTCPCGCGASLRGWSHAGAHRRVNIRRVYRDAHGACDGCGQPLSQYGECVNEDQ